jgi:acyl-CoA thioesterase-1
VNVERLNMPNLNSTGARGRASQPEHAKPTRLFSLAATALLITSTGALSFAGCAKDPDYSSLHPDAGASGGSSAGGTGGTGGATGIGGARAVYMAPACNPDSSTMGQVANASPLISVGKRVTASTGVTNAGKVVDGLYPHAGMSVPAAMLPAWIAIELGSGPSRLLLSWADVGWGNYNDPTMGGSPAAYTIETSGDSTNGQDGAWQTVVTVTANSVRERAHTFPFAGKTWVRFSITAAASATATTPLVAIDEIAIHDISVAAGTTTASDTWFFMGDSITVNAFRRQYAAGTSFDAIIHAARPAFSPNMLDGGIGGELSTDGLKHLPTWLMLNPDVQHVALMYGTNDSWGDKAAASTSFEANMNAIVQMVLDAGKVPILARLPYSEQAKTTLPQFNTIIDKISTDKKLPCGPDLYDWFRVHPEQVSVDGVHPSEVGYRSINKLWAEAMSRLYPAN